MSGLIDSEGRLFGRINLVDAVLGAFVLLLVPLAYATYLLFQLPAPTITSVEPAPLTITEERAAQGTPLGGKLKVRGSGLRPVLRATVGDTDAIAFIFENPTTADVLYGGLPAGRHDLVLYDGVQEVARAAGAVDIPETSSPVQARVGLAGLLLDVPADAAHLRAGAVFPSASDARVEIVALGDAEPATFDLNRRVEVRAADRRHRPALLTVPCEASTQQPHECTTGGIVMAPGATFAVPGMTQGQRFLVEEVVPATPPTTATLRLRVVGFNEVLDLLQVGDVDQPRLSIDQRGATIRGIGPRRGGVDALSALLALGGAAVLSAPSASVSSVDVTVTAGLDPSRAGWRYRGEAIRPGGPFAVTTPRYSVRGALLDIDVASDAASTPR